MEEYEPFAWNLSGDTHIPATPDDTRGNLTYKSPDDSDTLVMVQYAPGMTLETWRSETGFNRPDVKWSEIQEILVCGKPASRQVFLEPERQVSGGFPQADGTLQRRVSVTPAQKGVVVHLEGHGVGYVFVWVAPETRHKEHHCAQKHFFQSIKCGK